ncbi:MULTISPECIES: hypothetical protein [Pseudomonas syringae group genomosp. 2]|uniref:hypothetical protein n=1 Tax=Pseudomonas syringae group genomosp. 2 TaxID=251698 RepID=UPI001585CD9B|nr:MULTISPECIES: hypothetical protein [Pseudomonas syringae group genomosp. 2]MCQ3010744.1 hypothetical protein [Pseudomonas savastanoi]
MSKNDSVANLAKKNHPKSRKLSENRRKTGREPYCLPGNNSSTPAARSTSLTLESCPDTLLFKHPDPWHRACNIPFVNLMFSGLLFLKYANQSCSPCLPDLDAHYATTPYFFLVANAASPDSLDGNDLHIGD